MADNKNEMLRSDCPAGAIVNFTYVVRPDLPLVSTRPAKIDLAAVQRLLGPGEKLLGWGSLPKSIYFHFDENLVRLILLGLGLLFVCLFSPLYPAWVELSNHNALLYHMPSFLFCLYVIWLLWRSIRKATYVLTDRRLMRIGTFVWTFPLSSFERALVRKSNTGTTFIELWTAHGEAPNVVLQLAEQTEAMIATFPLPLGGQSDSPAISAEHSDDPPPSTG